MSAATELQPATAAEVVPMDCPGDDIGQMMRIAIEQGESGVAALERLVAMRERAEDRLAERQYAEAIAAFQEVCPVVGKNAEGAHKARYATLDQIMLSIRPALQASGLSVTFDSEEVDGDRLKVWAVVHHRAGHSERASFIVRREAKSNRMNETQRDGSALSYGRRYAVCMALGISTGDVDDDGAGAGNDEEPCITDEQAANLKALAEEVGADVPRFLKWAEVESFADIRASRYQKSVGALERKR